MGRTFISLGAGVQSTTMLLLAYHRLIPRVDAAIFADTGWEPPAVYQHLAWLESVVQGRIQIYRVSAGNIREDTLAAVRGERRGFAELPFYSYNQHGKNSQIKRQCTTTYKTEPVNRFIRFYCWQARKRWAGPAADLMLGISLDEAHRMKPAREPWLHKVYPLIDRGWRRSDCLAWLASMGYPVPPKSACEGCPFHGPRQWRETKADPVRWADVTAFDVAIRHIPHWDQPVYLHAQRIPLSEVDLRTPQERGQLDMWANEDAGFDAECEGVCGI